MGRLLLVHLDCKNEENLLPFIFVPFLYTYLYYQIMHFTMTIHSNRT